MKKLAEFCPSKHLTIARNPTAFSFRLRHHYKAAVAAGVISKISSIIALVLLLWSHNVSAMSLECGPSKQDEIVDDSFLVVERHSKWQVFGQMATVFLPERHEGQDLASVKIYLGLYPGAPEWTESNAPSFMSSLLIEEWRDGRKFVRFNSSETSSPIYLLLNYGGQCGHSLIYEYKFSP